MMASMASPGSQLSNGPRIILNGPVRDFVGYCLATMEDTVAGRMIDIIVIGGRG